MGVHAVGGAEHSLFRFYAYVPYGGVRGQSIGAAEQCELHEVGV